MNLAFEPRLVATDLIGANASCRNFACSSPGTTSGGGVASAKSCAKSQICTAYNLGSWIVAMTHA